MSPLKQITVEPGSHVRLADHNPDDRLGLDKDAAAAELEDLKRRLADLHELLWAENKHALLVVLQGMDTSGKDGTIRHVLTGVNPQGCRVTSFKQPSAEELDHDFLWRIHAAAPAKGDIGIFNRSHYEDVLVVRVEGLAPEKVWSRRYDQINAFEELLAGGGITVLKFFLHISKEEQGERLRARLEDPAKCWKFSEHDLETRKRWDDYRAAYEDALSRCSTRHAPWFIVPANRKWVRNLVVCRAMVEALAGLSMKWPRAKLDLGKIKIE